jgi:VIT1/CCC1 family predicted Fe2+/Mn2+ transporter
VLRIVFGFVLRIAFELVGVARDVSGERVVLSWFDGFFFLALKVVASETVWMEGQCGMEQKKKFGIQ